MSEWTGIVGVRLSHYLTYIKGISVTRSLPSSFNYFISIQEWKEHILRSNTRIEEVRCLLCVILC